MAFSARLNFKFLKRKESVFASTLPSDCGTSVSTLRDILSLLPAQRTPEQIRHLMTFSNNLKVFQDLNSDISEDIRGQCCQHLSYQFSPAGKVTFT